MIPYNEHCIEKYFYEKVGNYISKGKISRHFSVFPSAYMKKSLKYLQEIRERQRYLNRIFFFIIKPYQKLKKNTQHTYFILFFEVRVI